MARMSLPAPTLHTARLRLRPFTGADADALFALHSSRGHAQLVLKSEHRHLVKGKKKATLVVVRP